MTLASKLRKAWLIAMSIVGVGADDVVAQRNDSRTLSKTPYVHHIELRDARGVVIDPRAPSPPPYSPEKTCLKCHDVPTIALGRHFNGMSDRADRDREERPGEPWFWVDRRTGTSIPLSYRDWPASYSPADVGLSRFDFALTFGSFGALAREPDEATSRLRIAGNLEIDCLVCHSADRRYRHEEYAEQVEQQNFAWAPTAAAGLGRITGRVDKLKDDFDPLAGAASLPSVEYDASRFDADGKVYLELVKRPRNAACYRCHTERVVDLDGGVEWLHDGDVHLRAGLSCVDCHRNGIAHHTVRGFPGERSPDDIDVSTLSCAGCHGSGRLGAPKPMHRGLPPLHLDSMSCTSCHSGPVPAESLAAMQTSMAHRFAIPSQTRSDDDPPSIVGPVYQRDDHGMVTPYRLSWPSFFGISSRDGDVRPIAPVTAYAALKKAKVRIRKDFRSEMAKVELTAEERRHVLGDEVASQPAEAWSVDDRDRLEAYQRKREGEVFAANLALGLAQLGESAADGETAVYVAAGEVFRLDAAGGVTSATLDWVAPYRWPIAHDVRPARQALGATGCAECHRAGAPLFYGNVEPTDRSPLSRVETSHRYESFFEDAGLLQAWERLFRGRPLFKGFAIVSVILLAFLLLRLAITGLRSWTPRSGSIAWRVSYVGVVASVVVLAATAAPSILDGGAQRGWRLLFHLGAAGLLLGTLPGFALLGSRLFGAPDATGHPRALDRVSFFGMLATSAIVIATILVAMFHWLDTDELRQTIELHRWSGIALVALTLVHVARAPFRRRR